MFFIELRICRELVLTVQSLPWLWYYSDTGNLAIRVYHHGVGIWVVSILLIMLSFQGPGQYMMVLFYFILSITQIYEHFPGIFIWKYNSNLQVSRTLNLRCPAAKYLHLYHIIIEIVVFLQQFLFIRYVISSAMPNTVIFCNVDLLERTIFGWDL